MIYAISGLVLSWSIGMALGDREVEGLLEVCLAVLAGSAIIIMLVFMLFCLGHAIDMQKGTEKNLWIIGILFASLIVVPYFYFKHVSKRSKTAQPVGSGIDASRRT